MLPLKIKIANRMTWQLMLASVTGICEARLKHAHLKRSAVIKLHPIVLCRQE